MHTHKSKSDGLDEQNRRNEQKTNSVVGNEEDEEAIASGCVLWVDSDGFKWCRDVFGAFGTVGTVSKLVGDEWHVVELGEVASEINEDGCVYWMDENGVRWCRDVVGAWGPANAQYHSEDGSTWYGTGDAWLTLSDEAADYFAARRSNRCRFSERANNGPGSSDHPVGEAAEEIFAAAAAGDAAAAALYGPYAAEVAAMEAAADAAFDEACRGARPVLWPELPLRL